VTPRLTALLAAAALALPAPTTRAAAPPLLSIQATFAGTDSSRPCTKATCTVGGESQLCHAVGVDATTVPFAGGCAASFTVDVRTSVVSGHRVCSPGRYTGTFELGDDRGDTFAALPANVVLAHGVAKFVTEPVVDAAGFAYVGSGEGSLAPACVGNESVKQVFRGRFTYVRLP
jgi:hypothetical protein